jgi:nuclear GTP-binding protein
MLLLLLPPDLVPREVGEAWLKYYRQELPTVAFKASTQQQSKDLKQTRSKSAATAAAAGGSGQGLEGGGCLGADTLLQLLKNYTRWALRGAWRV